MTVELRATEMQGTVNVIAECNPGTSRFKIEYGDVILSESLVCMRPGGSTLLTQAISIPANAADFRVRVGAFDDADTQQYVFSETYSFPTSTDSKFDGKTL